jgi:large subunit ribosomal protein L7/L12
MRSSQPQTQSQGDQSAELHYAPLTSATDGPIQLPQPEGEVKKFSPKIESLVNEITKLNLIEVGELNDLLKKKLNLPDTPLMPVGGFSAVPAAAAPEVIE